MGNEGGREGRKKEEGRKERKNLVFSSFFLSFLLSIYRSFILSSIHSFFLSRLRAALEKGEDII